MNTIVINKVTLNKLLIVISVSLCMFLSISASKADAAAPVLVESSPGDGTSKSWTDMVVPSDGRPVFVTQTGFKRCADTSCSSVAATHNFTVGSGASVIIAPDGLPMIAYADSSNAIYVRDCTSADCSSGTTTNIIGTNGRWPTIAAPTSGNAVVAYNKSDTADAMLFACSNAACSSGSSSTLHSTNSVGWKIKVVVPSDNKPVAVFQDDTASSNGGIRLVKCGNAGCTSGNTTFIMHSWSTNTSHLIAMKKNSSGYPVIAFANRSSSPQYIYLINCPNADCTGYSEQAIDTSNQVYTTNFGIADGTDGLPVVAYGKGSTGTVVVKCSNFSCSSKTTSTLYSNVNSSQQEAVAVNSSNIPFVVFDHSSLSGVNIVKCDNTSCNPNTAPTISGSPSVGYGCTWTGDDTDNMGSGCNYSLQFNSTDTEQTTSNALTYYIHTGANRTGTPVASGNFTSSTSVNTGYVLTYNASGLSDGTPTLYLSVFDGTAYSSQNPSFTLKRDGTVPTTSTSISTNPVTVGASKQYTVTFTLNDARAAATEMSYRIRTGANNGGTLLTSGGGNASFTRTTATIDDPTLIQGSNNRYIRACDGGLNCSDTLFTVTFNDPKPLSVTAVASDPPPVLKSFKNTLKGSANPNGSTARGHFRLYTSAPDCTLDTNGTRVPSSAGNDPVLGSGSSPVAFSVDTTVPLVRQTNYWYCAYADNDAAGQGNPSTAAAVGYQTFTTPDGPAGGCDPATTGDLTITDACTFPATDFDGVDSGGSGNTNTARITLGAGGNVTILAGQKVARGSISFSGGLLTLQNGNGGIIRGGVYLLDADGDGYIDNNTSRYVGIAPPAGYVRRNYLATTTYSGANYDYASKMYAVNTFDCNTASAIEGVNVANLAVDVDQDGYYTGATGTSCVGGTSTVNGRTYYRVADGSYSKIIGSPTGGANAIAGSDCYDNTGEPCKPTINSVGSATQTSLVVTFTAGAGPSATGSALLWCDRTANGSCAPNIRIAGSVTSPYTHNATITCGKNYAYKVTSQNASGESDFSADVVGTTSSCASAPSVTTSPASSVAGTTAILNSIINPNGASTNVIYRYGTSNVACSSLPSTLNGPNGLTGSSPLSGGTTQNTLTGLAGNTTYYFCVSASNGIGGQQYGSVENFTTTRSFYDLFTDTNGVLLENHTPDFGTGWTKLIDTGSGNLNIISTSVTDAGDFSSAGELYVTNNTMDSANYKVSVRMTTGDSSDDYNVIAGRVQDSSNMYAAEFNNSQTRLYKKVSGSWLQLGSTATGIANGSTVTLNMYGSIIEVLDDGVALVSITDTSLSSAGKAGIGMGGVINSTGDFSIQVMDTFEVIGSVGCLASVWYRDADVDGFGTSSTTAACGTAGYIFDASDCYDSSANAKPGQTSYFESSRGDGSWDYDCNSGVEISQMEMDCCTTASSYGYDTQDGNGYATSACNGTVYSINQTCFNANVTSWNTCNSSSSYCGKRRLDGTVYYPTSYTLPGGGFSGVSCPSLIVKRVSGTGGELGWVSCR